MGAVPTALADARLLSISQIATEWQISRDRVRSMLSNVSPRGEKGGHPAYSIRDAARVMVPMELGLDVSGDIDPEMMPPKERKDWYDGEAKRLDIASRKRELIPAFEHINRLSAVYQRISRALQTATDVVERDVGLNPEQARAMDKVTRRLLEDAYRSLVEPDDMAATG